MRDIEGIEESLAILRPHLSELEHDFNQENQKFLALVGLPHDELGRVLKCHLIIERYLEEYLRKEFGLSEIGQARLSFFQKAILLPNAGTSASFIKLGVLELNTVRNKFGHSVGFCLENSHIEKIRDILQISRPNFTGPPVDSIEAFTAVACAFLLVPSPDMRELFKKAFAKISVNVNSLVSRAEADQDC